MLEAARRAGSGFEASAAVGFMAWALVQGVTPVPSALERSHQLAGRFTGERVAQLEVAGFRAVLDAMEGRFDAARAAMADSRQGLAELELSQAAHTWRYSTPSSRRSPATPPQPSAPSARPSASPSETGDRWFQATVRVDLAPTLLLGRARDAAAAVAEIDTLPAPSDAEWVVKRF